MALSKDFVRKIIGVIAADGECRNRVNKRDIPEGWMRNIPSSAGAAGPIRNWVLDRYEYWGGIPPAEADAPGSAYLMERLCNGIGQAVQNAAQVAVRNGRLDGKQFRDLGSHPASWASPLEMRRNDTFFGHYANAVRPSTGGCYILDWWMTLDLHNPMVWQYADWKNYPWNQTGVPFERFGGFSGDQPEVPIAGRYEKIMP